MLWYKWSKMLLFNHRLIIILISFFISLFFCYHLPHVPSVLYMLIGGRVGGVSSFPCCLVKSYVVDIGFQALVTMETWVCVIFIISVLSMWRLGVFWITYYVFNDINAERNRVCKGMGLNYLVIWGHFANMILLAWINNYIHYSVSDEISYLFPNLNSASIEVWEWISIFIPHLTGHVITYPCWD